MFESLKHYVLNIFNINHFNFFMTLSLSSISTFIFLKEFSIIYSSQVNFDPLLVKLLKHLGGPRFVNLTTYLKVDQNPYSL